LSRDYELKLKLEPRKVRSHNKVR